MASTITTSAVKEIHTGFEDAVTIDREAGSISFAVQHYSDVAQFSLVTLDAEENGQPVEISLAEAKHLRALLNTPSVVALLETAE